MYILSSATKNIRRHWRRWLLFMLICAIAALTVHAYIGAIGSTEHQMLMLPEAIPVSAHVTNQDGSRSTGLQIHEMIVDGLIRSSHVKDLQLTTILRAGIGDFHPEEQRGNLSFTVAGVNTLDAIEGINPEGIAWMPGYDSSIFSSSETVCMASAGFMASNGLQLGDAVRLNLYYIVYRNWGTFVSEPLAIKEFLIVAEAGSWGSAAGVPLTSVIIPIGTEREIFNEQDASFTAASASFLVSDPLELNMFKEEMKANWLSGTSYSGEIMMSEHLGRSLIVNDATFINAATRLMDSLTLLRRFLPVVVAALAAIGYFVAYLAMQSRRDEYTVMRLLGMSGAKCVLMYLVEIVIITIVGSLFGIAASIPMGIGKMDTVSKVLVLFVPCFLLGGVVALLRMARTGIMASLRQMEI